jgi:hypothetical protein
MTGAQAVRRAQVPRWCEFSPRQRGLLACAALVLTVAFGGCGASSSHSDSGARSSPPPTPSAFTRLGYRFAPPTGWVPLLGTLDWGKVGGQPAPGDPQFDTFELNTGARFESILFGRQRAPHGMSVDDWIAHLSAIGELPAECSTVLLKSAVSLGGEAAMSRVSWCPPDGPDAVLDRVFAIHQGQGWMAVCLHKTGSHVTPHDWQDQCMQHLSSFEFLS